MATNFSPCKRSYVFNQFPSSVMFVMNVFHVSASGGIQGHDGRLVKHGSGEWGLFALYRHEKILRKSSSQKLLIRF